SSSATTTIRAAGDPGRAMTRAEWHIAAAAGILVALALLDATAAHELDDIFIRPNVSRYALTQAFLRGGAVERDALEAELAAMPGAAERAGQLGRDIDSDGDPDELPFHLGVLEVQEEGDPAKLIITQ